MSCDARVGRVSAISALVLCPVLATVAGSLADSASAIGTGQWYVSTEGDDAADCLSVATTCVTIGAAIGKAGSGDQVLVAAGFYIDEEHPLVVDRDVTITGGWDPFFEKQEDRSALVGATLWVGSGVVTSLDRFEVAESGDSYPGILNQGDLTISLSDIHDHEQGGIASGTTLTLRQSVVRDNARSGVRVDGGVATIIDSTISGNVHNINVGGGVENQGDLTITNTTISGNRSATGGGINNRPSGKLRLLNSTITKNSAILWPNGGGVQTDDTVIAHNTIVAGNTNDRESADWYAYGGPGPVGAYNLIGGDPLLDVLRDNGGPTKTHAFLPGSPAIDAANPASPGSAEGACELADQRGVVRPQGIACDIGSFEMMQRPNGEFTSLTPARILDTRDGTGRGGVMTPLGADQAFEVQVTGEGGVAASGVSAVVMNVTVTEPTAASFLTVWPAGLARPVISNLNYVAGQTVPNLVTVAVGDAGRVSVYNRFGTAHVVFDVVGFYADDSGPWGSRFHAIDPFRYFDTRDGSGGVGAGPIGPNGVLAFNVLGKGGVPAGGVSGVVMNVTATQPSAVSFLTVYPGDVTSRPLASNLNYLPGMTVPNLVVVRVPPSGVVKFFNRFGNVDVIADVVGYYDDEKSTEEGRFVGTKPSRTFDSREDFDEPFFEDSGATLQMAGWAGVPPNGAGAVVLNVTATQPTASGFVTVFPDDLCEVPFASNVNFGAGQTVPNQVVSRLSLPRDCADSDLPGAIHLYNRFGFVHLIVDVFGYFTDDSSYTRFVTITDDTGSISVDVPRQWNDIFREPVGKPPEPFLVASTDLAAFSDSWDVPAIAIQVSRTLATTYPTPAAYLASLEFDNVAECDSTDSGPYDDGVFVGKFFSADGCGTGNAQYFFAATQQAGTDYYVIIEYQTVTPQDVYAMNRILASIEVTLP